MLSLPLLWPLMEQKGGLIPQIVSEGVPKLFPLRIISQNEGGFLKFEENSSRFNENFQEIRTILEVLQ